MADMVRRQGRLVAVRVTATTQLAADGSGPEPGFTFELFDGAEALRAITVAAADISSRVPDRLYERVFRAGADRTDGGPLWLQLADGVEELASLPWEAELAGLGVPLLRVPNFVRNGYAPPGAGESIVVCAADTRPGGRDRLRDAFARLLGQLDGLFYGKVVVCVSDFELAMALEEGTAATSDLSVIWRWPSVEDIRRAELSDGHQYLANPLIFFGPGRVDSTIDGAPTDVHTSPAPIGNGWLRWIAYQLAGTRVHAVHFLCPDALSGDRGLIALPDGLDVETSRSTLVGARDIAAFADTLGCRMVGFGALDPPWHRSGIAALANAVSWLRPGPLLAAQYPEVEIGRAYAALLRGELLEGSNSGLMVSAHPASLADPAAPEEEAVTLRYLAPDLGQAAIQAEAEDFKGATGAAIPEEVSDALTRLSSSRPRSPAMAARARGELRALELISSLAGGPPE